MTQYRKCENCESTDIKTVNHSRTQTHPETDPTFENVFKCVDCEHTKIIKFQLEI